MTHSINSDAIDRLRQISLTMHPQYEKDFGKKELVFQRYQKVFSRDHLKSLTDEEFRSFLIFENNGHWKQIHRYGSSPSRSSFFWLNKIAFLTFAAPKWRLLRMACRSPWDFFSRNNLWFLIDYVSDQVIRF